MLKKILILCPGSDTNIPKQCSNVEQNKNASINATIFFAAVMATIAVSYALFTVFDNSFMVIGFSLIWG